MKYVTFVFLVCLLIVSCNQNEKEESIVSPVLIDSELITAAFNFQGVESFAHSFSSELKLRSIRSDDVNFNGFSKKWCFEYTSVEIDYYFHTTHISVGLDSNSTIREDGSAIISHEWMNSNEVLLIAEKNGGEEFRTNNKEYQIIASLGEPLVPNSKTCWYIRYLSLLDNSKKLDISIDATTGELL